MTCQAISWTNVDWLLFMDMYMAQAGMLLDKAVSEYKQVCL